VLDILVEETDTEVVITATVTDGQILDCMGDWTEVELDSLLEERVVVDGSGGETVEVERG
jgi:hypothetical protein